MGKKYFTIIIGVLILQFSNAQSDSTEAPLQYYLTKVDITDTIAFKQAERRVKMLKSNELLLLEFGKKIDSTNNWELILREVFSSASGGISEEMKAPHISIYLPIDPNDIISSQLIFNDFGIRESNNQHDFVTGSVSDPNQFYSWTPFIYKDYLVIEMQSGYIGGQIDYNHRETYYLKKK